MALPPHSSRPYTPAADPPCAVCRRYCPANRGSFFSTIPTVAAAAQLRSLGIPGSGTFELGSSDLGPQYTVRGTFEADPAPEVLNGEEATLPGGLRLLAPAGDWLMGPSSNTKLTADMPTPCYSGHVDETLTFEFPANKHVVELPKGVEIADRYMTYTEHWTDSDNSITVKREFNVSIDQPLCTGELRAAAVKDLAAIRNAPSTSFKLADD